MGLIRPLLPAQLFLHCSLASGAWSCYKHTSHLLSMDEASLTQRQIPWASISLLIHEERADLFPIDNVGFPVVVDLFIPIP